MNYYSDELLSLGFSKGAVYQKKKKKKKKKKKNRLIT